MKEARIRQSAGIVLVMIMLCGAGWADLSDGLVAHWTFDEGQGDIAHDSAGGNHGAIHGAQWAEGRIGGALEFDGVDDCVDTVDIDYPDSFSVSLWVNLSSTADRQAFIGKHTADGQNLFLFGLYEQGYHVRIRDDWHTAGVPAVGWRHLVVTAIATDGRSEITLYRGGRALWTHVLNEVGGPKDGLPWTIGQDWDRGLARTDFFSGAIDDVRIYAKALSAEEVRGLYEQGLPEVFEYHVDGSTGDDGNDGLSRESAFATIQRGIDAASDGDTVLVWPGIYGEAVDFDGKAITVRSADEPAVLEVPDYFAVLFVSGEGPDSVLRNFVVRGGFMAVFIAGASPTISNLTVVDNQYGIEAYAGAQPDISNCIFYNNSGGDLFQCEARYSWVEDNELPVLPEGLVAYWNFDEGEGATAYDSAGANHGTINGATWTEGIVGYALAFDGLTNSVAIEDSESLDVNQAFTIAAWVNATQFFGDGHISGNPIVCKWKSSPIGQFHLTAYTGGNLAFRIADGYTEHLLTVGNTLSVDTWHHVIAQYGESRIRLFVDGAMVRDTVTSISSLYSKEYSEDQVSIGHDIGLGVPGWYFAGKIDCVRIYNRALFAEEVGRLYQAGLSGQGLPTDPLFVDAANGDYHLRSERGRYWGEHDVWVLDSLTSPCVNSGDPAADVGDEPEPNGGRINMGAYGGTRFASMGEREPMAGDLNGDGVVNMIDMAILADSWLRTEQAGEHFAGDG